MNMNFRWHVVPIVLAILVTCLATAAARDAAAADGNIAVVATPSAQYHSGDTSVAALNNGSDPRRSADRRRGAYGNWPRTGTQWVQYEWSQPISTERIDVYWWADGQGVHPPKACRLFYWDGSEFVEVKNADGLGVERDRFNTTTFDEVTTDKLRLEIDSDDQGNSTGILQWKVVDSGRSPKFPPSVEAGVDRTVIRSGKTYLSGELKTIHGGEDELSVTWSKESGPGDVSFDDASAVETAASFSETGQYVLKLTAKDGDLNSSSTLTVKVEPAPPESRLRQVNTRPYKINSPLWNHRAKALIVHWIPYCIERMSDPDIREGGINNFVEAANKLAGRPAAQHRGYVFANAWVLNTLESICVALMIDPQGDQEIIDAQNQLRVALAEWIPIILAAQEPDGYLQTAYTLSNRERWAPRHRADHEGYVAGYLLEAAVVHHQLTDGADTRLYDAAKRLADCWYDNIGPSPKKHWYDEHQGLELALVRFARHVDEVEGPGAGDNYVELAKFLLDCRGDGSQYDQSHLPVQQQYEAVGHAVRALYQYTAMADIALETDDTDYHSAVMSLWDNIINRKYYVTGGIGSGETSEGFGPDYSLRHNAYCETCSSCGQLFFQHRLNMTYQAARFADLYEETIYNAILGGYDLDGRNFYYQNPLDTRGPRYPWHGCPCCVGNFPRTLLMLPTWMYLKDDDGVYVNLFVGSTATVDDVAGVDVELVQETDYPWHGEVAITVNPAAEREFAVNIRVPTRDVSELYSATPDSGGITSLAVNGEPLEPKIEDGYARIVRTWKPGDRIELVLPLEIERVKSSDLVEANLGRVALRRGPIVYNIESVDQDVDKVLALDAPLTAEWRPDLLGGVMVITGQFTDDTPLLAIPNYARFNRSTARPGRGGRGGGERSTVWIQDE